MTVLITGGTGFIGAKVVRLLLERGEQRPVVFHVSSHTQRLGDVLDKVELVRGDLGNFNHILDVVKQVKPSVIYHLGAAGNSLPGALLQGRRPRHRATGRCPCGQHQDRELPGCRRQPQRGRTGRHGVCLAE